MKKIIAILLVAIMALGIVACGSINEKPVVILWSGEGVVEAPNTLINAMERAMYIENVNYVHKGAKLDAKTQFEQAKNAINDGCAVLAIELINPLDAQKIVNLAKEKNIPVIFFNCLVPEEVIKSYDKCVFVGSDTEKTTDRQGELIADYVENNFKDLDRNGDGKISYVNFAAGFGLGNGAAEKANKILAEKEIKVGGLFDKKTVKTELVFYDDKNPLCVLPAMGAALSYAEIAKKYNDENKNTVELIITDNELTAYELLVALQNNGFNKDKLTTHLIPMFTVGGNLDYKSIIVSGRPEISDDLKIDEENDSNKVIKDKEKKIKEICKEYYEKNMYIVDLTIVEEVDLDDMIYTTVNVIDSGRIAGTVMEDNDAIAVSVATVARNFIKGNDTFKDIETTLVKESEVLIPYSVYPNS